MSRLHKQRHRKNYDKRYLPKGTDKSYGPGVGLNAGIQEKMKCEMEIDGKCKCGNSSHKRTIHKDCPMNKKRKKHNASH